MTETATQVHLKAPQTGYTGAEPDCIGGGVVTGERPLGGRVVIDDAPGQQVRFVDPGLRQPCGGGCVGSVG